MSTPRNDELESLAHVPAPRRSDAAFVRAVADGVARRRARPLFALPALAAAVAAVTFMVMRADGVELAPPAAKPLASPLRPIVVADPFDDEDTLFALPSLEGSSDEELVNLDRILDRRIAANRRSP